MSTKLQTISPAETETGLDDTMRDAEEIHSDYSQQKETIQPKPVEEWSKLRNHSFGELVNPIVKRYEEKPIFETADWTSALKWQTKGHTIIRAYSNKDVYCTSEIKKT